jgi:hypothetical protein
MMNVFGLSNFNLKQSKLKRTAGQLPSLRKVGSSSGPWALGSAATSNSAATPVSEC